MADAYFAEELRAKAQGLREMARYFRRRFGGRRGMGYVQNAYRNAAADLEAVAKMHKKAVRTP